MTRTERESDVKTAFNCMKCEGYEPKNEDVAIWNRYVEGEITTDDIMEIYFEKAKKYSEAAN